MLVDDVNNTPNSSQLQPAVFRVPVTDAAFFATRPLDTVCYTSDDARPRGILNLRFRSPARAQVLWLEIRFSSYSMAI